MLQPTEADLRISECKDLKVIVLRRSFSAYPLKTWKILKLSLFHWIGLLV